MSLFIPGCEFPSPTLPSPTPGAFYIDSDDLDVMIADILDDNDPKTGVSLNNADADTNTSDK
jgi:hypothetical protein